MSDKNFEKALETVFEHEGGYNDVKGDKGGATNYGISLRFLKLADEDIDGDGHVDANDIRALTLESAAGLYKEHFWDHYKLARVETLQLSTKMLDIFVNMRGRTAAKVCQRALEDCGHNLAVDGILGRISFGLLNEEMDRRAERLIDYIRHQQAAVYRRIVQNNPTQEKFLRGWLNRAKH